MDRQRQRPDPPRRVEHLRAVATGRVRHELAGVDGAGVDEPRDESGQDVVRDGEEDEVGVGDHLRHRQDRHPGQERVGTQARHVRHRGHSDDLVAGPSECCAEDSAHATGPHDPDAQPRRPRCAHVTERRPLAASRDEACWSSRGPVPAGPLAP